MARIAPFRALRFDQARFADLAPLLAPPYDVINETQRKELEARHPRNIVHLDLPRGEGDARYDNARAQLDTWLAEGTLRQDARPALYRYEQQFTFTGGVAKNESAVNELRKLIRENYGERTINISDESIYTGALGGSEFARRALMD